MTKLIAQVHQSDGERQAANHPARAQRCQRWPSTTSARWWPAVRPKTKPPEQADKAADKEKAAEQPRLPARHCSAGRTVDRPYTAKLAGKK